MADSTTNLDTITSSQPGKEVTANAFFDAASHGTLYGRRASTTTALTWGYYGGRVWINGAGVSIANGTVALTASATNIVQVNATTGAVSVAATLTAGNIPVYTVVTGASSVTSYTDEPMRAHVRQYLAARMVKAMTNVNYTLTGGEWLAEIMEFTGTHTADRDVVLPLIARAPFSVFNNTTGGFNLRFIGATGTGVTVAAGKRAMIHSDGTNIVRDSLDA